MWRSIEKDFHRADCSLPGVIFPGWCLVDYPGVFSWNRAAAPAIRIIETFCKMSVLDFYRIGGRASEQPGKADKVFSECGMGALTASGVHLLALSCKMRAAVEGVSVYGRF